MKRRIGIYPGTFDPIHTGHIAFAEKTLETCSLDEIIFIPEHNPRYKPNVTDLTHRLNLIELATQSISNLHAQRLSSQRFTVAETLPELRALFDDANLTLLLGSDVAQTLPGWSGLDSLLSYVSLAIGMRAEDDVTDIAKTLGQYHIHPTFIFTDHTDITSSAIRNDATIRQTLQSEIHGYIQLHKLYE